MWGSETKCKADKKKKYYCKLADSNLLRILEHTAELCHKKKKKSQFCNENAHKKYRDGLSCFTKSYLVIISFDLHEDP